MYQLEIESEAASHGNDVGKVRAEVSSGGSGCQMKPSCHGDHVSVIEELLRFELVDIVRDSKDESEIFYLKRKAEARPYAGVIEGAMQ